MSVAQWPGLVVQASIILTVLGLGLTASCQDAVSPRLLLRALLSMNIVMPIVAALVATVLSFPYQKWRMREAGATLQGEGV